MVKGFKATLFAGVISLGAFAPAYAAAPVISGLPDIQIGDLEDAGASDSNLFVFSNAFNFDDYVTDADTPDDQLLWSFGEFTNDQMSVGNQDNQYAINGVEALVQGDVAIAAQEELGNPIAVNPGANRIDASSDLATFRDIVFSPGTGSGPFPDPVDPDKSAAEAGKGLRFYVSDGVNVGYHDVLIETVDDEFDALTATDGYQEVVRDTDFLTGWELSGIQTPEVAISATPGQLNITVLPAQGRYRILGWVNKSLYPYDSVGATKFVRGKFYVATNNETSDPTNEVPAFRLRVTNEGVIGGAAHFEYAQTGLTDPGYEPFYGIGNSPAREAFGSALRPSNNAAVPSLYKVDFDPVDVPNAANSQLSALIESYTVADPANGTLSLLEFALATYDALDANPADLVWSYNRATGLAGGDGGAKTFNIGAFNAEATAEPGRRHDLYVPGIDAQAYAIGSDQGAQGLVVDTDPVSQDVYGIGIANIRSTNNTDKLRIEAGKLYHTRFYATSEVPTASVDPAEEIQGNMRFRFQTVADTTSYFLDMAGVAGFSAGPKADEIAVQALPGVGSENPDTNATLDVVGEDGGWYSVVVPSPLDIDAIREDNGDNFGTLGAEPGPGAAGDSAKDVTLGVDLIQLPSNLSLGGGVVIPFARPNRAQVRISAIEVYAHPSIDDGGYDY